MPTYTVTDPASGKTLTITGPTPPSESMLNVMFKKTQDAPAASSGPSLRDRAANAMGIGPAVGATVGSMAGGVPGAAIGGAAGTGFEQLVRHAKEIPGALKDVASNLVSHPRETLGGFVEGAKEGATDAGISAAVNAGLEYGGQAVMNKVGSAAKAVYRGYLKPSLAGHSIKDAQAIVDTAIAEGLPIDKIGKERAQTLITSLKGQVKQILNDRQHISQNAFGDIDLHEVANKVRTFAKDKYYRAGRPTGDFEAAMKVADNIDAHPSLNLPPGQPPGPQPVTLTEANEVKRTLQSSAGDLAFGVQRSAGTEAEKHGAYQIRTELEKRASAIGPLNARESKLIDVAKALNHAIEREANQNALVGVKSVLAAGAGGAEYGRTRDPFAAVTTALAARALMTPAVASRAAILASKLGKVPGVVPATAARVALAVVSEAEGQSGQIPQEP